MGTKKELLFSIGEDGVRKTFQNEYIQKEFREYNHGHGKRGRAVIINYEFKGQGKHERLGSKKDIEKLTTTLGDKLKFDVDVWDTTRLGGRNLIEKVKQEAKRDEHKNSDCFLMVVMTHGHKDNMLQCNDDLVDLMEIVDCFKGDKCENLRGKPKIFIIQACRGNHEGVKVISKGSSPSQPVRPPNCLPLDSDNIIARSQYEGYLSFRHPESGSCFIQLLCEILEDDSEKENGDKDDLLSLLTFTSNYVSKFDSKPREQPDGEMQESGVEAMSVDAAQFKTEENPVDGTNFKQQPVVTSTLLRLFFFYNKEEKLEA